MRYQHSQNVLPWRALPFFALREAFRERYTFELLRRDILAGTLVGVVALPLAMALGIAVGVAPQYGLYAAIVGGFVIALMGGSPLQVSGPTAAFVAILAPIYVKYGLAGLLVCGMMGGVIQIMMGLLRLGKVIGFIPYPVTMGFTAGIATVIATLQLKDFGGLQSLRVTETYFGRIVAMYEARSSFSFAEFFLGSITLALLLVVPRFVRRVPVPLVVLPFTALGAFLVTKMFPQIQFATIASRFQYAVGAEILHGIPRAPPQPLLPWMAPGPQGAPLMLNLTMLRSLLPSAFTIALLGAIESLLSAVVADGMARTKHHPDAELVALGVGNIVAPFFGGIACTGAFARTATNIRAGAHSPISAMVHAVAVLLAILAFAPVLGFLPMSALAALLLIVAWNMADVRDLLYTLRIAPRSDVVVLLVCFALTVAFDMIVGLTVGMVLAAMLFMGRMAEVTQTRMTRDLPLPTPEKVPDGVVIYDISGALFFGAAQKAMATLQAIADNTRVVILRMHEVQLMDVTGLVALESALEHLKARRCLAILVGVQAQPMSVLQRAGIDHREGVLIFNDLEMALTAGKAHNVSPT